MGTVWYHPEKDIIGLQMHLGFIANDRLHFIIGNFCYYELYGWEYMGEL